MYFEACQAVFWSLSCYKEPKLIIKLFTGCTLGRLLTQKQNISLRSLGMQRKQNFETVFGLKVTRQSWLLLFTFSPPSFVTFLASFFSFAVHLVGFILVGKVFGKAFRILGLDERKSRWVVEQDFHGKFQVNVIHFFAFFSGALDWMVLLLVWFKKTLHFTQVSGQKLMMSQAVWGMWIRMGGYSCSGANGLN